VKWYVNYSFGIIFYFLSTTHQNKVCMVFVEYTFRHENAARKNTFIDDLWRFTPKFTHAAIIKTNETAQIVFTERRKYVCSNCAIFRYSLLF